MVNRKILEENLLDITDSDLKREKFKQKDEDLPQFMMSRESGAGVFIDKEWMENYRALHKLTSYLMFSGKREVSANLVEKVLFILGDKYNVESPERLIFDCVEKVAHYFRSRPKRVSGTLYQIPVVLSRSVARRKGLKFVVNEARKRAKISKNITLSLAEVFFEISKGVGVCVDHVKNLESWARDNAIYMKTLGRRRRRRRRIKL